LHAALTVEKRVCATPAWRRWSRWWRTRRAHRRPQGRPVWPGVERPPRARPVPGGRRARQHLGHGGRVAAGREAAGPEDDRLTGRRHQRNLCAAVAASRSPCAALTSKGSSWCWRPPCTYRAPSRPTSNLEDHRL